MQLKPGGSTIPFYMDALRFVNVSEAREGMVGGPVTIGAAQQHADWDQAWSGIRGDPCRTLDAPIRRIVAEAGASSGVALSLFPTALALWKQARDGAQKEYVSLNHMAVPSGRFSASNSLWTFASSSRLSF